MRYRVLQSEKNRIHIDLQARRLKEREADVLYYSLMETEGVVSVQVLSRIGEVIVRCQVGARKAILAFLDKLNLKDPASAEKVPQVSVRATNELYKDKIAAKVMIRLAKRFMPFPVRAVWTVANGMPYIINGLKDLLNRNFSAEIVHASAILASLLTGDFSTASSIIFLTDVGEILEEWTYKKSVGDLAQSLALNVAKVWKVTGVDSSMQVDIHQIEEGDEIIVSMGSMIPLDGVVVSGEALVNQAALTGESILSEKRTDSTVYAGTVLEEGELVIRVKGVSGETRYDRIVRMIEDSESMKANTQSQAEQVVGKLVPWLFGTSVLTWLFTRSLTKAASVLMVDFSCAIEVAMPVAVLSAIREASRKQMTVKGGRFFEKINDADTIVFDKTGTLTRATPVVERIVAMEGRDEDEMLALAASLEEHFPHSLANAVVRAAKEKNLPHRDIIGKPTYIVAHGIVSNVKDERVVIGSYHFIMEDEAAQVSDEDWARVLEIPSGYSRLYMAIGGKLAAVIGIADPIKEDAKEVVSALKDTGIEHIVMMTGDSEQTAKAIAGEAGITEFYAEVLPEDKAGYVQAEIGKGRSVIMIGDGINDSPALSAADVGIAMREGADIAREIADITLSGNDLAKLVLLRQMSGKLLNRMNSTARIGIAFNAGILLAGMAGLVMPGTAALLHNVSTIGLCVRNMSDLVNKG
ncbi:MAG: heavy metal translocating P-type ATPase [Lachnospiraceae bacterium]|nr:heavy metal translocating P-type ATPase [Lachnospiraceae bacterium]